MAVGRGVPEMAVKGTGLFQKWKMRAGGRVGGVWRKDGLNPCAGLSRKCPKYKMP